MRPGEAVELQLALVLEAEVAGALGQLFDNGGGEDLTGEQVTYAVKDQRCRPAPHP
jgi:hypothetical protein